MRRGTLLAALCGLLLLPPGASAADYDPSVQPPFGGQPVPPLGSPGQPGDPPAGFELTPREAITIADRTEVVRAERRESPGMRPGAFTRGPGRWEIKYFAEADGEGTEVAQIHVDDESGRVLEAWRDHQVETKLARGYDGAVGRVVNSPWIWIPLCLLFVLPFVDPRRPLRLVHVDLLAIAALSLSLYFFNRGEITTSVPLVYPVLAYLLVRMLLFGLRPRRDPGALVPFLPVNVLAVLAIALAAGRIALNIADSSLIDVGVAGVVGADRLVDGMDLYGGVFAPGIDLRGDVYGPLTYLTYVPFELVFPWQGAWDEVPAAHAAAIVFDLLTAVGLLLLGRRLREGSEGRVLGVALAFAWLACPWTAYALNANTNDGLVAVTLVGAMLAISSPALRGAWMAAATATKLGPAVLAPLFATATGERKLRSIALFTITFGLVVALLFLPFIPDGGPREIYDRTFGYQASRGSPFSLWGLAPSLDPLQPLARILAVVLALTVAFVPSRRSVLQVAALAAGVLIATQLTATHWFYFYVLWFLPLALVASFGAVEIVTPARRSHSPAGRASAS